MMLACRFPEGSRSPMRIGYASCNNQDKTVKKEIMIIFSYKHYLHADNFGGPNIGGSESEIQNSNVF